MINENIFAYNAPKSPVSEAYRVLRTNLQFTCLDSPARVLLVTSSGPSEGKSTTVSNLAVTFAQSSNKVIIIDADLRKPRIHKIFGISNRFGLTNAIIDPLNMDEYIHKTEVDSLEVLTSGPIPPNPSELLGSGKMKDFLARLKERYDIILLDSPPVGIVTDAQVLATLADGSIIVAASGQVSIEALKRSKELLEKVNATILGVIVNKLERESNGYYYYYYYRNYEDGNVTKTKSKKRKTSRKAYDL